MKRQKNFCNLKDQSEDSSSEDNSAWDQVKVQNDFTPEKLNYEKWKRKGSYMLENLYPNHYQEKMRRILDQTYTTSEKKNKIYLSPIEEANPKGYVEFATQQKRPQYLDNFKISMHEENFTGYDIFPNNHSKNRRMKNVSIGQLLPRDNLLYNIKMSTSKLQGHEDSLLKPRCYINYKKMARRNLDASKKPEGFTEPLGVKELDQYMKRIHRKELIVNIDNSLSRIGKKNNLPLFMQKFTSRNSLYGGVEQTLQNNCYHSSPLNGQGSTFLTKRNSHLRAITELKRIPKKNYQTFNKMLQNKDYIQEEIKIQRVSLLPQLNIEPYDSDGSIQ